MANANLMSLSVELYQAILWYLGVPDRTRMLCVSKVLFQVSLPVAWYEVYGLDALFLLLPVEISETLFEGSSIKHVRIIASQLDKTPSRLQAYATNIRILRLCSPKLFRYKLLDVEKLDRVLPTPNLEKLTISPSRTNLDQPISKLVIQTLQLCMTDNVKCLELIHTSTALRFESAALRLEIKSTLAQLRLLPKIQHLHLGLDFFGAAHAEAASPLSRFQGFDQLTYLSAPPYILIPNIIGIEHIARLPNLARLHLEGWHGEFLIPRSFPSRPPASQIWFPNLREIDFDGVDSDRAYILLSSTLPEQLRCVKLKLNDQGQEILPGWDQMIDRVIESISQHRDTLEELKLEHSKDSIKVLSHNVIPALFELNSLRSLEVTRFRIEHLGQTAFMTAWPLLTKLHWLDQIIDPQTLMTLAQQRPLIEELAFTISPWIKDELPPPGFPQPAPKNRHMSLSEVRENWYLLSERSVRFTARFMIAGFSDELVSAMARYFVWCWRGVELYRVAPARQREGPKWRDQDAIKYSRLLVDVSAARARLYARLG
ncbi:hypothetical protein RSAG8_10624, partial [Rhizoctonia solani AG-8 WAC10335]